MREREQSEKLLKRYRDTLPEPDPQWPSSVRRSIHCIHTQLFDSALTVEGLKEKCILNGNNFSGKFKYYVGLSPQQYIIKHRLAAASQLLKHLPSDYPLLYIAFAVGYRSHAAFSRTFKRRMGQSPSKCRKC